MRGGQQRKPRALEDQTGKTRFENSLNGQIKRYHHLCMASEGNHHQTSTRNNATLLLLPKVGFPGVASHGRAPEPRVKVTAFSTGRLNYPHHTGSTNVLPASSEYDGATVGAMLEN